MKKVGLIGIEKWMMRMAVLGSGSGGNSTVLQSGNTTILVDAGLSAKQLRLRMELLGVRLEDIDGVLLTHEHSDHAKGVRVLLKDSDIPVYANALTREFLEPKLPNQRWKVFQSGASFSIGEFNVKAFPVPHDAQDPVGYVIGSDLGKVGILTDIGYATKMVVNALKDLDALFLEANYDQDLLDADTKRPWSIKQRISSRHGHLSNEQAAELYGEIACDTLNSLVIGHLSSDCNTPECVTKAFEVLCKEKGVCMPESLVCASQHEPTTWQVFGNQKLPTLIDFTEGKQGELFSAS